MILAIAGRRIDAPEAPEPVFPYSRLSVVRTRLLTVFSDREARAIVCSAACGADLLALDLARCLGIRKRVILPFAPQLFRESSVIDRPGDWGPLFDRVIAEVAESGDLVNLDLPPAAGDTYLRTNDAILEEALLLSATLTIDVGAVLVWDGVPRAEGDTTYAFGQAAIRLGLPVFDVSTL